MPIHEQTTCLPYTPQQLFDLVIDIERYPEFLPWVAGARILEHKENQRVAELLIRFKSFRDRYTSLVVSEPPQNNNTGMITVTLVRGPFDHLDNSWIFAPIDGGTKIEFKIDFAFNSTLLEKLIGTVFDKATHSMVEAFTLRAKELYN